MGRSEEKAIDAHVCDSRTLLGDSLEDVIKVRGARQLNLKNI